MRSTKSALTTLNEGIRRGNTTHHVNSSPLKADSGDKVVRSIEAILHCHRSLTHLSCGSRTRFGMIFEVGPIERFLLQCLGLVRESNLKPTSTESQLRPDCSVDPELPPSRIISVENPSQKIRHHVYDTLRKKKDGDFTFASCENRRRRNLSCLSIYN